MTLKNQIRKWADFRNTAPPKLPAISREMAICFSTPAGQKVLDWLRDEYVIKQLPVDCSECAFREAEGKKRLVLDLTKKIEDYNLDLRRQSDTKSK